MHNQCGQPHEPVFTVCKVFQLGILAIFYLFMPCRLIMMKCWTTGQFKLQECRGEGKIHFSFIIRNLHCQPCLCLKAKCLPSLNKSVHPFSAPLSALVLVTLSNKPRTVPSPCYPRQHLHVCSCVCPSKFRLDSTNQKTYLSNHLSLLVCKVK